MGREEWSGGRWDSCRGHVLVRERVTTKHPMGARLPTECLSITAYEFCSLQFEVMFNIPSYQKWYHEQEQREAYAFHHQFLRHLQWRCPGDHWVLKTPAHLGVLESLLAEYPDALIIQTHRDPLAIMPSISSLVHCMRCTSSDSIDGPERSRAIGTTRSGPAA